MQDGRYLFSFFKANNFVGRMLFSLDRVSDFLTGLRRGGGAYGGGD